MYMLYQYKNLLVLQVPVIRETKFNSEKIYFDASILGRQIRAKIIPEKNNTVDIPFFLRGAKRTPSWPTAGLMVKLGIALDFLESYFHTLMASFWRESIISSWAVALTFPGPS